MKFHAPKTHVHQPLAILRKAGYSFFIDPLSKKESYVLRMTGEFYPRFHLYIKETGTEVIFDLHLDQKKASYAGSNMHGGEYDGPAVEREMGRIKDWVAAETGYREGVEGEEVRGTSELSSGDRVIGGGEEIREQRLENSEETSVTKDETIPKPGLFGGIF